MTLSSPPGEGQGAVKSTSWKDILKTRCWSTDVTDGKPLLTVPVTRALRELLRKGITSQRAKQSHERPEGLTFRTVHCISLSQIWEWLSPVQLFVTPWTVAHQAPWSRDFPGMNTGVGCHSLLQGIFPTQGLNTGLLHCRQIFYHVSHQGSSIYLLDKILYPKLNSWSNHPTILNSNSSLMIQTKNLEVDLNSSLIFPIQSSKYILTWSLFKKNLAMCSLLSFVSIAQ